MQHVGRDITGPRLGVLRTKMKRFEGWYGSVDIRFRYVQDHCFLQLDFVYRTTGSTSVEVETTSRIQNERVWESEQGHLWAV
jgi:hypothetical protein